MRCRRGEMQQLRRDSSDMGWPYPGVPLTLCFLHWELKTIVLLRQQVPKRQGESWECASNPPFSLAFLFFVIHLCFPLDCSDVKIQDCNSCPSLALRVQRYGGGVMGYSKEAALLAAQGLKNVHLV